jgi:hypothetical protein
MQLDRKTRAFDRCSAAKTGTRKQATLSIVILTEFLFLVFNLILLNFWTTGVCKVYRAHSYKMQMRSVRKSIFIGRTPYPSLST